MRNRIFFRAAPSAQRACELQRLDQVGDVVGLGVERLQRRRGRRGRREVVLIEVEDQLPGVDGGAPVVEPPDVELRRARQQIGAAADVRGVAPEGQLLIDLDQLGEALQRRRQPLDLRERVGVERIGRQHLAPGGERDSPRLQLVLLQVGHARQQRGRLRPLQDLALHLEDRRQARPGAALLVDRRQDLARRAGAGPAPPAASRAAGGHLRGWAPSRRSLPADRARRRRCRAVRRAGRRAGTPAPASRSPGRSRRASRAALRDRSSAPGPRRAVPARGGRAGRTDRAPASSRTPRARGRDRRATPRRARRSAPADLAARARRAPPAGARRGARAAPASAAPPCTDARARGRRRRASARRRGSARRPSPPPAPAPAASPRARRRPPAGRAADCGLPSCRPPRAACR